MSVSFYGQKADQSPIRIGLDDEAYLNMANGNAVAFLEFLGITPNQEDGLYGEITVPEARRAIMRARALFERRVDNFTRETFTSSDGRFIESGIDREYFKRRLDSFEKFLNAVVEKGATAIYWG